MRKGLSTSGAAIFICWANYFGHPLCKFYNANDPSKDTNLSIEEKVHGLAIIAEMKSCGALLERNGHLYAVVKDEGTILADDLKIEVSHNGLLHVLIGISIGFLLYFFIMKYTVWGQQHGVRTCPSAELPDPPAKMAEKS